MVENSASRSPGSSPTAFAKHLISVFSGDTARGYESAGDLLLAQEDDFGCATVAALGPVLQGEYYDGHARAASYFFQHLAQRLIASPISLRDSLFALVVELQLRHGQSHSAVHQTKQSIRRLGEANPSAMIDIIMRLSTIPDLPSLLEICKYLRFNQVAQYMHALVLDERPEVRLAAMHVLTTLRYVNSFDFVTPLLNDGDDDVRIQALRTLFSLDPSRAVRAARPVIDSASTTVQLVAIQLMGEAGDRDGLPSLESRLVTSSDPSIRLCAAKSIGLIGPDLPPPALTRALGDSDPDVRGMAAWALGEIGDPLAHDSLVPLTSDSKPFTAWSAQAAIRKIEKQRRRETAQERFDP
jgi:HEAT repeats